MYAVFNHPDHGYPSQGQAAIDAGLVVGERYEVEHVYMGQSNTTIKLVGFGLRNSVLFDFENDDGTPCNIYTDPKYNPYINI